MFQLSTENGLEIWLDLDTGGEVVSLTPETESATEQRRNASAAGAVRQRAAHADRSRDPRDARVEA